MNKVIWITGMSHVNGNEYLENKFLPLCRKRKRKVKIIYPGKMIFEAPGIRLVKNNVLYAPEDHLKAKMQWVFEKIEEKLERYFKKYDEVIIKGHKLFRWNDTFMFAHAPEYVIKFKPDVMFTFIDGIAPILDRLNQSSQFRFQGYIKRDICDWQQLEVDGTKEWAEMVGVSHFVIPSAESPELLYSLIFNKNVEPVYVAMDITHSPEVKDRVDNFIFKMRKYFPALIDTRTAPFDYDDKNSAEERHVVGLCLNWFIPQSKIVIGYYPIVSSSQGKPHELGKAYILTKDVWIVYIPEETNLFVESFKTRPVFRTEEEFFEFLKKRKK